MVPRVLLFISLTSFIIGLAYSQIAFVGSSAYSDENIERAQWQQVSQDLNAIVIQDKSKQRYKKSLDKVELYPKLSLKKSSDVYKQEFDTYVRSLFPYMLEKIKNDDFHGESKVFYKALKLTKNMETRAKISELEINVKDFIYQHLKTDKALKACHKMISNYNDQRSKFNIYMQRIDEYSSISQSDLDDMRQDLYFLESDLKYTIKPSRRKARMPASVSR